MEIALTFDDSPRAAKGYFDGPTRAKNLIENLKKHSAQAAFFSVSGHLNAEGRARLQAYADAGHLIGNHTHSHLNINDCSLGDFQNDFLLADQVLSNFKTYVKWFRFPYLREGNNPKLRDGMRKVLEKNNYFNAYITADGFDWHLDDLFQKAILQNANFSLEKFCVFYCNVLADAAEFYEQMAQKHLRRSPKHVLLLHETDTAALFIGNLIDELKKRGWKVISPIEAYKDDIAKYMTAAPFKGNPGRVGEIARDRGETSDLWSPACNENYLNKRFTKEVLCSP